MKSGNWLRNGRINKPKRRENNPLFLFTMNLFDKTPIGGLMRRIKSLNEGRIFVEVMSEGKVQAYVVKLNTDQMKVDFMNSDGVLLSDIGGEYSDFTMQAGRKKSKTSVDLYDTGEFHESFRVERVRADSFEINSDPVKDDGTNLLVEWGKEIEGLTFESLEKTSTFIIDFYVEKIRKHLGTD